MSKFLHSHTSGVLAVKLNKIVPGRFFLKNGLPYEGLLATESFGPNELILSIPQNLCFNTRHAYVSRRTLQLFSNMMKLMMVMF